MKNRRKPPMIPMMPDTRARIASAMHLAVEVMLTVPSNAATDNAARQLAILTAAVDYRAGAENMWQSSTGQNIETALGVLENVLKRNEGGGDWSVTEGEGQCLRSAAAQFDHVLRLIPFNVYRAAEAYVAEVLSVADPT